MTEMSRDSVLEAEELIQELAAEMQSLQARRQDAAMATGALEHATRELLRAAEALTGIRSDHHAVVRELRGALEVLPRRMDELTQSRLEHLESRVQVVLGEACSELARAADQMRLAYKEGAREASRSLSESAEHLERISESLGANALVAWQSEETRRRKAGADLTSLVASTASEVRSFTSSVQHTAERVEKGVGPALVRTEQELASVVEQARKILALLEAAERRGRDTALQRLERQVGANRRLFLIVQAGQLILLLAGIATILALRH